MCVKTILYLNLIYHITLLSTSYIHTYIYIYHIYMYHITFFLIGGQLLYNIVVYFAIHWHESAMGVHVSPILNPTPTSLPPSGLSQCTSFECPVSYIELGLVIYSTLGQPRVMGGRQEGGSDRVAHVHPWLIHVSVWQKPLRYCKVISLQLK